MLDDLDGFREPVARFWTKRERRGELLSY